MSDVEGPLKSLATRRQPFIGRVSDAASRSNETLEAVSVTRLQDLQRLVGNHVVAGLMPSRSPVLQLTAQRQVFKEGSKDENAAAASSSVKDVAKWVMNKTSVQPGGTNYLADVQGRGLAGFKKGKNEYVGGSTFANNPMPDKSRLPYANGEIYQEWDTEPCTVGSARGAARIVTSSTRKVYYTVDHYANFTEFST